MGYELQTLWVILMHVCEVLGLTSLLGKKQTHVLTQVFLFFIIYQITEEKGLILSQAGDGIGN